MRTKQANFEISPEAGGQWLDLVLASPLDFSPISVVAGHKESDPFFASGSFLMFPWVNRLDPNPWAKEPFYPSVHWLTDGNGIPSHGLYHNLPRDLIFEMESDSRSEAHFSFRLPDSWKDTILSEIRVTESFVLTDHELKVRYRLENLSGKDFPFSLGIHPYFRWGTESYVDDLYLFGSGFYEVKLGDYLLPERLLDGTVRLKDEMKLEGRSMDHLYKSIEGTGQLGLFSIHRKEKLIVGGGHFFQVYIPNDRKSIAIEPMTSTGNFLHFSGSNPMDLPRDSEKTIEFFIRMDSF
ncbi:aldose 1-epimerase [Leptospira idonii]|uniref:aldose epimerase family protein n=1 Tax=Leptospira idonii TaxID=1193500 RepID=UPI001FE86BD0|nr:aldose 1-epimerase [Leptospira idonii]